jgi:glutathione peroxidase
MMKQILFLIAMVVGNSVNAQTVHSFKVENIDGKVIDLASFKGKKIMIVNTASKCGLTPQYEALEALYKKYQSNNFVIIGFPSNDFFKQEPGDNAQIKAFCLKNYGVSFPMMAKISVKGKKMHPLYSFLTTKGQNGLEDNNVKWTFQKYLIDANGKLVRVIGPTVSPMDESIQKWIEEK